MNDETTPWARSFMRIRGGLIAAIVGAVLIGKALTEGLDWISVAAVGATAAIGGALTAVMAAPLRGRSQGAYQLLCAGGVVASIQLGVHLVSPEVRAWRARGEAEEAFEADSFFVALGKADPKAREQFLEIVAQGARQGASREEARARGFAWGLTAAGRLLAEHLPTASDEALVRFFAAQLRVADQLAERGDDSCHVFLFGTTEQRRSAGAALVPESLVLTLREATGAIILTSVERSGTRTDVPDGDTLIDELLQSLLRKHGESFETVLIQLDELDTQGVDMAQTCLAAREMFRAALELPAPRRAQMVRALLSNQ